MEKILTIVIPTYNMQDYLRRCLDSLIVPAEQMKQLEVLVINDGSKDNSSAIAHEYQDKFPTTFRVIDKENGNYGSCVNRGLKEATGKYIKILDADDWYNTNAFINMLKILASNDVDMLISRMKTYYDKSGLFEDSPVFDGIECNHIYNKYTSKFDNIDFYKFIEMHRITYRTSLLRKMGLQLQQGISYTDTEYSYYPFEYVNSVLFIDDAVYVYWIGRDGQTVAPNVMAKRAGQLYKIVDRMLYCYSTAQNKDIATRNFQCKYLANKCSIYYYLELMVNEVSRERNLKMRAFDIRIKKTDPVLYKQILMCPRKSSLFIKCWRVFPYSILSRIGIFAKKVIFALSERIKCDFQ